MNLVGQIITLPVIEAFTSHGTPIAIGNNKDEYFISAYHAPNSAEQRSVGTYELEYIKTDYGQQNWPIEKFYINENILESAIGEK